jgi:hypothetical protein
VNDFFLSTGYSTQLVESIRPVDRKVQGSNPNQDTLALLLRRLHEFPKCEIRGFLFFKKCEESKKEQDRRRGTTKNITRTITHHKRERGFYFENLWNNGNVAFCARANPGLHPINPLKSRELLTYFIISLTQPKINVPMLRGIASHRTRDQYQLNQFAHILESIWGHT